MVAIPCPHCAQTEPVIRHGTTSSGTPRCRCKACNKTFALAPKSRAVSAEKEAAIERHLQERTSIRGICRALSVSAHTVYDVLKKSRKSA